MVQENQAQSNDQRWGGLSPCSATELLLGELEKPLNLFCLLVHLFFLLRGMREINFGFLCSVRLLK